MNDPKQPDKSPAQLLQHHVEADNYSRTLPKRHFHHRHYRRQYERTAYGSAAIVIDLLFKPNEPSLRLRLEESQLLLAYIGEILAEIEAE